MNDVAQITAARLRRRADHCRELASTAFSAGVAAELQALAKDYDRDAAQLALLGTRQHQGNGVHLG